MKFNKIILCLVVLCVAIPACAQMGGSRQNSEATIKGKKISVTYGSPSLKGRDVFSLAPVGTVWRLGMNQPTTLETTGALKVAGKTLEAGKYSLWAKKTGENSWVLAFHPTVPGWGSPELKEGYVAELPLKTEKVSDAAEQLNISVVDMNGKAGIKIHWGTAVLVGAFDVN
jgi:hypothetical protein